MGLVASQARLLLSFARKSDLEFRAQTIANRRMRLAFQTGEIARAYAESISNITPYQNNLNNVGINDPVDVYYTPDDTLATQLYEARTAELQAEDKRLEMELKTVDIQHKAVETEIDAIQKVIDKNIEKSFKVMG